jgi:hypothetical protein
MDIAMAILAKCYKVFRDVVTQRASPAFVMDLQMA